MTTGVKAAVLREINQPLSIETITLDKPAAGEVLVRTAVAGVCHSDFHFMNGSYESKHVKRGLLGWRLLLVVLL